jgi:hypothetical protein
VFDKVVHPVDTIESMWNNINRLVDEIKEIIEKVK